MRRQPVADSPTRALGRPDLSFSMPREVACDLAETPMTRTQLERTRVTQIHSSRLESAVGDFVTWCETRKFSIERGWNDADYMAGLLAHYTEFCRNSGQNIGKARYSILGIQAVCRPMRGRLTRAWDAIASWQLVLPVRNRLPIPRDVVESLALVLVKRATSFPQKAATYWSAAILVRLGFHGLCRPGELLSLVVGDLNFCHTAGEEPLVLAIGKPKNRGAMGRTQFRVISHPGAAAWAEWYCNDLPPWAKLWPHEPKLFRAIWDWGLEALGVSDMGFTPGCLRPGGTTALFRSGMPVSSLRFRGGWSSEQTLSSYVQEAMACMIWNALDKQTSELIRAGVARDSVMLASAPPRPWLEIYPQRQLRGMPTRSSPFTASPASSRRPLAPRSTAASPF